MLKTVPALRNVARIPDAAPRWADGTLFMIAVVFGAANRPDPMPLRARSPAKIR